jgi:hypothetical protein
MSIVNETNHFEQRAWELKEGQTQNVMLDCANGPEPRFSI